MKMLCERVKNGLGCRYPEWGCNHMVLHEKMSACPSKNNDCGSACVEVMEFTDIMGKAIYDDMPKI